MPASVLKGRTQRVDPGVELSTPIRHLTLSPDGELVREALVDLLVEPTPILRESLFFLFEPHEFDGGLGRIHGR